MKIGFIGAGNMGGAIIKGYLNKQCKDSIQGGSRIYIYDSNLEKAREMSKEMNVNFTNSIGELVSKCDIIFLAVKPNVYNSVLDEANKEFAVDKIIVSMAAGITMDHIQKHFNFPIKIIRIMPNTPALVNESMTAVCMGKGVTESDMEIPLEILKAIGRVELVDEDKIHAIIGVSGSSPAYAYMFIEAIARAGEQKGLDYRLSLEMAAQSVLGASRMILETGKSPTELVEMVCSPNGTTIEAVKTLGTNGFNEKVTEAVFAAVEKSIKMSEAL